MVRRHKKVLPFCQLGCYHGNGLPEKHCVERPDPILMYDTDPEPKEYKVTGGVPRRSVMGTLFWNIIYDTPLNKRFHQRCDLLHLWMMWQFL